MKLHFFPPLAPLAAIIAGVGLGSIGLSSAAQALSLTSSNFGSSGILFNTDTTVQFKLVETRGKYQSFLGVYTANQLLQGTLFSEDLAAYDSGSNDTNGDWLGTLGKTFSTNTSTFTFQGGVQYFFGLTKVGQTTPYSFSPTANTALFDYDGGTYTYNTVGPTWIANHPNSPIPQITYNITQGWTLVGMEDGADADYQDFILEAKAVSVPEPSLTLALLGFGVGLSKLGRRHPPKNTQSPQ